MRYQLQARSTDLEGFGDDWSPLYISNDPKCTDFDDRDDAETVMAELAASTTEPTYRRADLRIVEID